MNRRISVLLLAPASTCGYEGDFGDPHLVALGSYLQAHTDADVEIVDLDYEPFLDAPDPQRIFRREFDVVGVSCYSSYDYLTAFYLGCEIRRRNPDAILVTGGYHASARPEDFLNLPGSPLDEPSPFDHVVVGEGELPLARIVAAAGRGERLTEPVLGPQPLGDLDDLPELDWSLLDRYRTVAPTVGGQATIHFSRGCPFHCSFCMERSKGESRWRAYSPARAERELLALDRWLGLEGKTVFIADAAFGLDTAWRRETLRRLARLDVGPDKLWTLTRVDLVDAEDLQLYHRAGFGLGLGLESGDVEMLKLIDKAGVAEAFLDRFVDLAAMAAEVGLPWGANMIAGHPGETPDSLRRSAEFAAKLFLETPGLTGFLFVDPFRLYPGSLVDRNLAWYVERFGTRVHRPRWWNYSEQPFNAEWIDPSAELDYRRKETLTAELFEPIVDGIAERFAYAGPAREYFLRSVARSKRDFAPSRRLRNISDYHLWRGLTGQGSSRLIDDAEARALFRRAREEELADTGAWPPHILAAVIDEPRERYVPEDQALESWRDASISLTDDDRSTVSALHAYLTNYTLLDLQPGDRLIEIGGGTGYGAALAARIVGDAGSVVTFEIIEELAETARRNLADRENVTVIRGDGLLPASLGPFNKAAFTCAVAGVPQPYLDALPEGGRVLAPVRAGDSDDANQVLTRYTRTAGRLTVSRHGDVRYVPSTEADVT